MLTRVQHICSKLFSVTFKILKFTCACTERAETTAKNFVNKKITKMLLKLLFRVNTQPVQYLVAQRSYAKAVAAGGGK